MATIVSTPAELDAVRNALGADYEMGSNIDLDGYGSRFQRFTVDDPSALSVGMYVFQYYGEGYENTGQIWNIDGNNLLVKLFSSVLSFEEGMLLYDGGNVTASFSTAPYDGSVVTSWVPIGHTATGDDSFTGSLAAAEGVKITNMTVNSVRFNCGLIAFNRGDIRYVDITGDVTGGSPSGAQGNGLVAGINEGTIYRCITRGSVTSTGEHLAGVAGYNTKGTIDECVNHANVNSSYFFPGGICGRCDYGTAERPGIIRNCYNTGTVTATKPGGIVGEASRYAVGIAQITNCHNVGTLVGSPDGGGIYGRKGDGATFVGCKYLADTHVDEADGVEGLTSAEMKDVSNFDGWDFNNIWAMGSSYPVLRIFLSGLTAPRFSRGAYERLKSLARFVRL